MAWFPRHLYVLRHSASGSSDQRNRGCCAMRSLRKKRYDPNQKIPLTIFQKPNFGNNADGEALKNRIQTFACRSLPVPKRGIERKFAEKSMSIIHWIVSMTHQMDLFHNPLNNNPYFEDDRATPRTLVVVPEESRLQRVDSLTLTESILPGRLYFPYCENKRSLRSERSLNRKKDIS